MNRFLTKFAIFAVLCSVGLVFPGYQSAYNAGVDTKLAPAAPISITQTGVALTENFNTLARSGEENALTIPGWMISESGGGPLDNEFYQAGSGLTPTGDTYSFGSAASDTDRALGGIRSGALVPRWGVSYINNTGAPITRLDISYWGEQWRFGEVRSPDQLIVSYSLNATSLTTGIWTEIPDLNYVAPNTGSSGSRNGNAAQNRAQKSASLSGLNIPNGATFYMRWDDFDASGSDDGLAVDDFSLTAFGPMSIAIDDVTLSEGAEGTDTIYDFTVSLSAPARREG